MLEKLPDKLPSLRKLQRETFMEELNRLVVAAITGKCTRRSAKNLQVKLPLPPKPISDPKGLGQTIDEICDLDLNGPHE